MRNNSQNTYDAIIIGAGIGGLVCGCYLAKAGMKVLIAEQHNKPGGYCSSFKRKGFTFDAAAHSFGSYRAGGNFRNIMADLGINETLKIKRANPSDIIITPDFKINFWNDTRRTISDLVKMFPEEKKNIKKFYNYFTLQKSANIFDITKLKDKSFATFIQSFFTNKKLVNSLSFPIFGNGGLPPSLIHSFTGTKIFSEFLIDGGYYPEGGMQELPNAFVNFIKQNNGNILFNSKINKIIINNNTITGVKIENRSIIFSKYVISACDGMQTFRTLIGKKYINNNILKKLRSMIPSLSTFILYIGIDRPFKNLPAPGTNIWHLSYYDLEKMYYHTKRADFNKVGGYMFRLSPDKKTILAFFHAPFKNTSFWQQNKEKTTHDFLNRIEKLIPELRKHIAYIDAATPQTLYRYTMNYKGADYGWEPTLSQLFHFDFQDYSLIKGFYLTGHWTAKTHGIPGVSYLGRNTAKLILRQEKINI